MHLILSSPILANAISPAFTDALAVAVGVVIIALTLILKRLKTRRSAVSIAAGRYAQGENDLDALQIQNGEQTPAVQGWNQLITQLKNHQDRQRIQAAQAVDPVNGKGIAEAANAASSLAQGIVVFDHALTVRYANGAADRFLNTRIDHLAENPPPADRLLETLGLKDMVQQAVQGNRAAIVQEAQQDPEDSRAGVLRATCRRLPGAARGSHSGLYMLLLEDITQQRVAEASRHAFIAEATHELRMPLQNIRLYVEEILDLGDDPAAAAERAESMNIINSEVIRLGHMIEEVLSISAVESGALSVQHDDVRLDDMLNNLADEYRAQAKTKNVTLHLNLPAKLPVLQADREKLSLALHNVVGNAVKYTPPDGRVSISVTSTPKAVTVDIADTGYGIQPEEHERIFERFYRANDRRVRQITGTGLGLAISRDIVRLHGGDIVLQSAPDQGSTFSIQLPPPAQGSSAQQAA